MSFLPSPASFGTAARVKNWFLAAALGGNLLSHGQAHAEPNPPAIQLSAHPLLGGEAPACAGWNTFVVKLSNPGDGPWSGRLSLVPAAWAWLGQHSRDPRQLLTQPIELQPGQQLQLQLPVYGPESRTVDVVLQDPEGLTLHNIRADTGPVGGALLHLLAARPSPLEELDGTVIPRPPRPTHLPAEIGALSRLRVSRTPSARAGEDPDFAVRAIGYAPVDLLLATGDALSKLHPPQRQALSRWVLAGGTLAVDASAAQHLSPLVSSLLAAIPRETAPPIDVIRPFSVRTPTKESVAPGAVLFEPQLIRLEEEQSTRLTGYQGGNLKPSTWGQSATYGLGEVHILAFSPELPPFVASRWSELKLLSLVRHALQRQRHIAAPLGVQPSDALRTDELVRLLRPSALDNYLTRAFALLVLGSWATGLWIHTRASRLTLRVKRAILLASATGSLAVLLTLMGGAKLRGVRHLTLIEAGAGMSMGTLTRHRAYLAAGRELEVRASHRLNTLAWLKRHPEQRRTLTQKNGHHILTAPESEPGEAIVVREEGFRALGAGISLRATPNDLQVQNRSGWDLTTVLLRLPDGSLRFADELADGQQVSAAQLEFIDSVTPVAAHAPLLASPQLRQRLDSVAPKFADSLDVLDTLGSGQTNWWPADVPVLVAQLRGGEGTSTDPSLVEDRVIVRVVGYGG